MRSGAAQTAVPLMRGSKRKGEGSSGAPTCSGVREGLVERHAHRALARDGAAREGRDRRLLDVAQLAALARLLRARAGRKAAAAAMAPARHKPPRQNAQAVA